MVHPKKLKYADHSLENSLLDDEDADEDAGGENNAPLEVLSSAVPPEKVLGKCGVWGETFFFKPGDSRLTGTLSVSHLGLSVSETNIFLSYSFRIVF